MNLPNKISVVRICLIPLMVIMFYIDVIPFNYLFSGMIFTVAAATDLLDGYIARKTNQVTDMGKFLDSIADKMLVIVALVILLDKGVLMNGTGFPFFSLGISVIVMREFIISGFRQIAAAKNCVIAADKSGKYKAAFQDIAIALLFVTLEAFRRDWGNVANVISVFAYVCFAVAVALTVVSGVIFMVKNFKVIK